MQVVALVESAYRAPEALIEQLDLGAHLAKRPDIPEAILEDRLVEDGETLRLSEENDERLLPVGHETRMGVGLHRSSSQSVGAELGHDPLVGDLETGAHPVQRGDGRDETRLVGADD